LIEERGHMRHGMLLSAAELDETSGLLLRYEETQTRQQEINRAAAAVSKAKAAR
jgi:hypothetical protein